MPELLRYDHYKVLGIPRDATAADVKHAFRTRAKACHPDVNRSPRANMVFQAVHEAYRILSDPELRRAYDDRLRHYREAQRPSRSSAQRPAPVPSGVCRERAPGRWDVFAFRGLHLTGLLFGITLTVSVLVGLVFYELPGLTLAFTAIGVGIIPDSLAGLRIARRSQTSGAER